MQTINAHHCVHTRFGGSEGQYAVGFCEIDRRALDARSTPNPEFATSATTTATPIKDHGQKEPEGICGVVKK
jgi:hypothetical protein